MSVRATVFLVFLALCSADPLLLSPLIQAGKLDEARARSAVLMDGKSLGHSGFLSVPARTGTATNNIYFWYQPCLEGCQSGELVVWLQGGPGAPGTHGAVGEIGNWFIDPVNGQLKERCFSWCRTRNCLFVDQPVQTGWSYQTNASGHYDPAHTVYTATSQEAMGQVLQVLLQFRSVFSETKARSVVIAGESYGGIYCAHLGKAIVEHNTAHPEDNIQLTAVLVGDPTMNGVYQWPTYAPALHGMGLVMSHERDALADLFQSGVEALKAGECTAAFKLWDSVWNDDGGGGAPGEFFELTGSSFPQSSLLDAPPAEWKPYKAWLASNQTLGALHADGVPESTGEEGGLVYSTMVHSGDFCSNSSDIYAQLYIDSGVDLLIFSSSVDTLLGPAQTDAGIAAMFDYAAGASAAGAAARSSWLQAKKQIWKVDSGSDTNVAGFAKCIGGVQGSSQRFCYVIVKNAGHEMPSYQPRAALDMYQRFMDARSWNSTGDQPQLLPKCAQCGGVAPFAGPSLPACAAV